jgi:hypothetical protein
LHLPNPAALAVDDAFVYWSECAFDLLGEMAGRGALRRAPR